MFNLTLAKNRIIIRNALTTLFKKYLRYHVHLQLIKKIILNPLQIKKLTYFI
jgi:hypothetical protein